MIGDEDNGHSFSARMFKIYSPKSQRSKISLIAHQREVTESSIYSYIPEFIDEFYEKTESGNNDADRNYIVKTYVFGKYLDDNVSLERGSFEFGKNKTLLFPIGQNDIEREAANLTKMAVGDEISSRQRKKETLVAEYVEDNAPWHRDILNEVDLSHLPYKANNEEIEIELQKAKFKKEASIKSSVSKILDDSDENTSDTDISEIVEIISESSKNDLVHYVALRRRILDIFDKSLQRRKTGKYLAEGLVHDIIFPRRKDHQDVEYKHHNLWIVDERLNFTNYLASDKPLKGAKTNRPDLIAYNKRVAFRGDNVSSNPVTIFEFQLVAGFPYWVNLSEILCIPDFP